MEYVEDFKKLRLSDSVYDSLTENHQPYVATFELLSKCNFKCIHCYLGVHRQETDELSFEQVKHIINELKHAGVIQIALTGGECTLRKDFIDIYKYVKENGFIVTVFTNASNVSDELIECFKKYPPFSVEISLYGASEETYFEVTGVNAFEKVKRNVEKLHDAGIHLSLKTPLMKQNVRDEKQLKVIAKKIGYNLRTSMALSPTIDREMYPTDYAISLCDRFLYEANANPDRKLNIDIPDTANPYAGKISENTFVPLFICNPGVTDVFIDYKGNVCPCIAYRSKGINLLEHKFSEIWDSFRPLKSISAPTDYKCARCECRYFCPICVGEQEEVHQDMCYIPKDVCVYSQARKKYYIDKKSIEEILEFIKNNI